MAISRGELMWDERYQTEEYVYGKEPNDFLRQASLGLSQGKVLCLAEGEGRNAVFMAQCGHDVTAVDASSVGLEKARKLAKDRGVQIETEVTDLAEFNIEANSFDVIVSIFCHVPKLLRKKLHQKVIKGLRPGGIFILEGYSPEQLNHGTGGPPSKDLLMSLDELRLELSDLEFEHAEETERLVVEGKLHSGRGAVVQIVGRKTKPT